VAVSGTSAAIVDVERLGFVWASNATSPDRLWPIACPGNALETMGGCWVADPILPLDAAACSGGRGSTAAGLVDNGENPPKTTAVFIPAGLTVSLWVTLKAPRTTHTARPQPGSAGSSGSSGVATICIDGAPRVNISTYVRMFELPKAPRLRNTVELVKNIVQFRSIFFDCLLVSLPDRAITA
jgi:hypothetical protein